MKPPPKKVRPSTAPVLTDEPQELDANDERLRFIAPKQKRCGLKVLVATSPHLETQTFNLLDVMSECQNLMVELLATLIHRTDSSRVEFSDYSERGIKLITNIFNEREPQLKDVLDISFQVHGTEQQEHAFITLLFLCGFKSDLRSILTNNDSSMHYMH